MLSKRVISKVTIVSSIYMIFVGLLRNFFEHHHDFVEAEEEVITSGEMVR